MSHLLFGPATHVPDIVTTNELWQNRQDRENFFEAAQFWLRSMQYYLVGPQSSQPLGFAFPHT
jgi:hypothetical protein